MPDIYSLPLNCALCSTFSIKQSQKNISRWVSQRTKLVPASVGGRGGGGGGGETLIPRREKCTVSNLLEL